MMNESDAAQRCRKGDNLSREDRDYCTLLKSDAAQRCRDGRNLSEQDREYCAAKPNRQVDARSYTVDEGGRISVSSRS